MRVSRPFRMNHLGVAAMLAALCVSGCVPPPGTKPPTPGLNATPRALPAGPPTSSAAYSTTAGTAVKVLVSQNLNPDCSHVGYSQITISVPPENGSVSIIHETGYSNFLQYNQRYACNLKKTPNTVVRYRSNPGFSGRDMFEIRVIDTFGLVSIRRFTIMVQ